MANCLLQTADHASSNCFQVEWPHPIVWPLFQSRSIAHMLHNPFLHKHGRGPLPPCLYHWLPRHLVVASSAHLHMTSWYGEIAIIKQSSAFLLGCPEFWPGFGSHWNGCVSIFFLYVPKFWSIFSFLTQNLLYFGQETKQHQGFLGLIGMDPIHLILHQHLSKDEISVFTFKIWYRGFSMSIWEWWGHEKPGAHCNKLHFHFLWLTPSNLLCCCLAHSKPKLFSPTKSAIKIHYFIYELATTCGWPSSEFLK